jgi:hypothetical protein
MCEFELSLRLNHSRHAGISQARRGFHREAYANMRGAIYS